MGEGGREVGGPGAGHRWDSHQVGAAGTGKGLLGGLKVRGLHQRLGKKGRGRGRSQVGLRGRCARRVTGEGMHQRFEEGERGKGRPQVGRMSGKSSRGHGEVCKEDYT